MAGVLHKKVFNFKEDTPHGLVKRIMYKKHIQAFIAVARRAKTWAHNFSSELLLRDGYRVLLVDGFAGKGRYDCYGWSADIEKYGSPVIALMVALNFIYRFIHKDLKEDKRWELKNFYDTNKLEDLLERIQRCSDDLLDLPSLTQRDTISLIFVEKKRKNVRDLVTNLCAVLVYFFSGTEGGLPISIHDHGACTRIHITDERYPVSCYIFNTSFVDFTKTHWINSHNLVDESTLCMTFVDPCGYTHAPMKELQTYLGPQRSLLINFMSGFINRFVKKNLDKVKELFCPDEDINDAMNDAVTNFVEGVVEGCRPNSDTKPRKNATNYTDKYERELRKRAGSKFSLTFEMRGPNNSIVYHLIFITNHQMQLESMKSAMNKGTQHSDSLRLSDFEIKRNGYKLNLGNIQDKGRVADAIFQKFHGRKWVKITEIKQFILMDTPYLFGKRQLAILMKEKPNPRITDALDKDGDPPERNYTFPDRGNPWCFSFRD